MNIFRRIQEWLDKQATDFRMERYLAQSTDCADLEYRMKKWQYMTEYDKSMY